MWVVFWLLFLLLVSSSTFAGGTANSDDEKAIRNGVAQWEEAWNTHDAKVGASLFSEDAVFINVNASVWKGRQEIEGGHAKLFAGMFKESIFHALDVRVRLLTANVALAHVKWEISGDRNPDGTPRQPRQGIFTQVLMKKGGKWLIEAWHNTNITVVGGQAMFSKDLPKQ
jgi:uncharacterized protein (TIGR02246 family)